MGNGFEDLEVWQKSRMLVNSIYTATATFPATEQFGLTSQLKRAVISIASNIAEGSARRSNKDFARFLLMSSGSAAEVKCQLILATDLGFISKEKTLQIITEIHTIARMLKGLRKSMLEAQ
jgi:four helix bundle protein